MKVVVGEQMDCDLCSKWPSLTDDCPNDDLRMQIGGLPSYIDV